MNGIKVIMFDDNDSLRDSVTMLLQDTKDFRLVESYSHCLDVIQNINIGMSFGSSAVGVKIDIFVVDVL